MVPSSQEVRCVKVGLLMFPCTAVEKDRDEGFLPFNMLAAAVGDPNILIVVYRLG